MLFLKKIFSKVVGGLLLSSVMVSSAQAQAAPLSPAEINSIARQTTVLIAPGLTQDTFKDLEKNQNNYAVSLDGSWTTGSGVIIHKEEHKQEKRYKYYILTVTHNFKQYIITKKDLVYGILTRDREIYPVEKYDNRRCPESFQDNFFLTIIAKYKQLIRFGCYDTDINKNPPIEGFDLAVVSFESDKNYPVAPLGDSREINIGDRVYISGWPNPEKEKDSVDPQKCPGKVERRQRRLLWVPVTGKIDSNLQESENGYSIFYTDQTRPGMSGGPVFDVNGRVVGVHGRASEKKVNEKGKLIGDENCSIPPNTRLESEDINNQGTMIPNSDPANLYYRYSSAQSANSFVDLIEQANIPLSFSTQPLPPEVIEADFTPIPDDIIQQDVGIFDDPNDVIENIYEKFRLHFVESAIKSQPSGACWSLLLGENFCND